MISRAAWEKALADLDPVPDNPDAVTMTEFRALLGVTKEPAQRRMKALIASGKAKEVEVTRKDARGRPYRVAAYVLL